MFNSIKKEFFEKIYNKKNYTPDSFNNIQNYDINQFYKKILFLGDSITELNLTSSGWVKYFNQKLKPLKSINVAVGGATWCDKDDTPTYNGHPTSNIPNLNVMGNQVQKVLNNKAINNENYKDFDLIIMSAGTNDKALNNDIIDETQFINNDSVVPLDKLDRKNITGAIRYCVETLQSAYPNAKICLCTPIQAAYDARTYSRILNMRNLQINIADRMSLMLIDSFKCGICSLYESYHYKGKYLKDGVHPNMNGAILLGNFIANEMINQIRNNESI